MIETPTPGLYKDVPFEDYLAWDAISNSRLNQAKQSLLHFRLNPAVAETQAMRIGSLAHCGVLEPLSIPKLYAVMPDYSRHEENQGKDGLRSWSPNTAWCKAKREEFCKVNEGKKIVDQSEYDWMLGIVESISRNAAASELLNCDGPVESSIIWEDQDTGLLCKARIDKLNSHDREVTDLKTFALHDTTENAAAAFQKTIVRRGYHRQMAHYCEAAEQILMAECSANIVAVDKAKPYNTLSAKLSDDLLYAGRLERRKLLRAIADAYEKDVWPGYENPKCWTLPGWYESTQESDNEELIIDGEKVNV